MSILYKMGIKWIRGNEKNGVNKNKHGWLLKESSVTDYIKWSVYQNICFIQVSYMK